MQYFVNLDSDEAREATASSMNYKKRKNSQTTKLRLQSINDAKGLFRRTTEIFYRDHPNFLGLLMKEHLTIKALDYNLSVFSTFYSLKKIKRQKCGAEQDVMVNSLLQP